MQRRRVQRTSLLCPKSHYSLEHLITGPLRNINTFYFRHRLTVFFKFSSIFVSSVASFWSIKKKKLGISSPHSPPWLTRFPVASTSKAQRSRDRNIDTILKSSVAQHQTFRSVWNQYEPQQSYYSPLCCLALSRIAKWLLSYQIDISSNTLPLSYFFSQQRTLDTI